MVSLLMTAGYRKSTPDMSKLRLFILVQIVCDMITGKNLFYLAVSGSGSSITFSVIHNSTIRADNALHCSHLVTWPT